MLQENKDMITFSLRTLGVFVGSVVVLYCLIHVFLFLFTIIESARSSKYVALYESKGGESVEFFEKGLSEIQGGNDFFTSIAVQSRQYRQAHRLRKSISDSYEGEYWRYHDSIVDHIQQMKGFVELGEELYIGDMDPYVDFYVQKQIELSQTDYLTLYDLRKLDDVVRATARDLQDRVNTRQRYMAYAHVLGLKNHIFAAHDFYRMRYSYSSQQNELRDFLDTFFQNFDREYLTTASPESLVARTDELRSEVQPLLDAYQVENRAEREKREPYVLAQQAIWKEKGETPPVAPYPNRFKQIYISLGDQYMYAYEGGDLIMSTPITSGRQNYDTIRGTFAIYSKVRGKYLESPFTNDPNDLDYYRLWVDFWLPFHGGYGIHDACNSISCWRTEFGGTNYRWAGSHGCVNTPYEQIAFLFEWAPVGTTVYVN